MRKCRHWELVKTHRSSHLHSCLTHRAPPALVQGFLGLEGTPSSKTTTKFTTRIKRLKVKTKKKTKTKKTVTRLVSRRSGFVTLTTPSEWPVTMTFCVSHSFISDKQQQKICWLRPVKVLALEMGLPLMLHTWMYVPAQDTISPCGEQTQVCFINFFFSISYKEQLIPISESYSAHIFWLEKFTKKEPLLGGTVNSITQFISKKS